MYIYIAAHFYAVIINHVLKCMSSHEAIGGLAITLFSGTYITLMMLIL